MVHTTILVSILYSHYVTCIFYHTYGCMVAFGRGTYFTYRQVRNIVTNPAKLYLIPQLADTVAETLNIGSILVEQVQHQSQSGLLSHPGQFRKLGHRIL